MLTRMLVWVLVTSRLVLVTSSRSPRLMVVTSRIDLLYQVFRPCCIFALLSLLHQPTIVLLYPRLKIRLSEKQANSIEYCCQGSAKEPALQAFAPGPHPDPCWRPPPAPPRESHAQPSATHSLAPLLASCALELTGGPSRSSWLAAFQT